ncbi:hypothetical protein [Mesorhizobium sp. CO1-1-8]|uniref:hypothetical protein n=1 Tax=Mesorhizobium sp. CO1-1-8 TaxID=2876631 RepID=UPI001CD1101D|nr:hypothetical protein [Mesorhizobium sp. CO1-1-8]MBZ9776860.1 hypothetical protein [Mesorhizobium sp. CO1-1-8]
MPHDLPIDLHRLVDHQALRQMLGVGDFNLRPAAVAVQLQLQGIGTAAIYHHQLGLSAAADVAAAALSFDEHVVAGRLAQRVDQVVRRENEWRTFFLPVKPICGISST